MNKVVAVPPVSISERIRKAQTGRYYTANWMTEGRSGETTVTEAGWLESVNIHSMLRFVWGKPVGFLAFVGWQKQPPVRPGERRLRLFACACCRRIERLFPDERLLQGVGAVEEFADGQRRTEDLEAVLIAVEEVYQETCQPYDHIHYNAAAHAVRTLVGWQPLQTEYGTFPPELMTVNLTGDAVRREGWRLHSTPMNRRAVSLESQAQCQLIRDIMGNPFRFATINPACLTWNDAAVVRLAQVAYDERQLPEGTLDNSRLAILADALEEAGCTDAEILDHFRSPGPHVRGCWAVDLCLGKS